MNVLNNPLNLMWITSVLGAALFFAAGALATRRRALPAAAAPRAALPDRRPAAVAAAPPPEAPGGEQTDLRPPEPTEPSHQMTAAHGEVAQLHLRLAGAEDQLRHRDQELQRFRRALDEVQKKGVDEAARWQAERGQLEERLARLPRLEAELEQRKQEVSRWRQELRDAEGQLARAPRVDAEQALRQDLAVKAQLLRANEQRLTHLEEENARLRQDAGGLTGLRDERDKLRAEVAQLRARLFAGNASGATSAPLSLTPGPVSRAGGRGHLFQAFVTQISRLGDTRCAVVADEMGLVVASHGTMGDEVAAVGALLSRAGAKAIEVLPLRNLHRVTVEDDQRVVLTLRPLPTRDGKESDLALLTLGVGVAPDPQVVSKLIDEGPRNILS
jgi:hypothetical protein